MIYRKINYISWADEAVKITLNQDEMKDKIRQIQGSRKIASTKTKRIEFDDKHYRIDRHGDWYELYLYEDNEYRIYSCNARDNTKNSNDHIDSPDRLFDNKFKELNGVSLRVAFGFVNKTLKRCIPKQFDYLNESYKDKFKIASSIDASSQYPSGCCGLLPDMHKAIRVSGTVKPSKEYPFAFYASGHLAIYNELDTHNWITNKLFPYLFRLSKKEDWPFRPIKPEEDETILMKASSYKMDSTWEYFYNNKKSCVKDSEEYNTAKLIMNKTIGCWHRKDKEKKRSMTYDNHGAYQLAHIVAVAIARGNQKILNKVEEIGLPYILHICVDGIIYLGNEIRGASEPKMGVFAQEFTGQTFYMKGMNVYGVEDAVGKPVKFKHSGFDLIYGHEIDENTVYSIKDLNYLGTKERISEVIVNG